MDHSETVVAVGIPRLYAALNFLFLILPPTLPLATISLCCKAAAYVDYSAAEQELRNRKLLILRILNLIFIVLIIWCISVSVLLVFLLTLIYLLGE